MLVENLHEKHIVAQQMVRDYLKPSDILVTIVLYLKSLG